VRTVFGLGGGYPDDFEPGARAEDFRVKTRRLVSGGGAIIYRAGSSSTSNRVTWLERTVTFWVAGW
jgi:hypothetical protein